MFSVYSVLAHISQIGFRQIFLSLLLRFCRLFMLHITLLYYLLTNYYQPHRVLVLEALRFYCCKLYLGTCKPGDNCYPPKKIIFHGTTTAKTFSQTNGGTVSFISDRYRYFICFDYPRPSSHASIISVAAIESIRYFLQVLMVKGEVFRQQFSYFYRDFDSFSFLFVNID